MSEDKIIYSKIDVLTGIAGTGILTSLVLLIMNL